ncbi:MAG: 30S ribosomal protein S9 [candidate division WS2 bacterium ADurb.Bin280]|uniref:Small ribosomal subunit protein uS9 n=1 Tax=candidate division WS2 bacterium ADurb.Bin280 TaxID=1852829 RepID=A0A1V5SBQ8_9BACT|nr:MAG: 30S ribosomal protein S9 [candidate division WS2 bacterium ADurb.Bin280]
MKEQKYYFGTGRRKTSVAQVRIFKGSGKISIRKNDQFVEADADLTAKIAKPFEIVGVSSDYDTTVILSGGGVSSRVGSITLGIARALSKVSEDFEKMLKKEGLLTRDSREKERKKPGLKRARRAPQWQKR